MPCKTKPSQSSRESVRMVHATPPDAHRPPKYHLTLWKKQYLWRNRLSRFSAVFVFSFYFFGPFTRLPSGSLEIRPWRPILVFVGRSRGLPENPKSMGWEIHGWKILGKSMDNSRNFGNSNFGNKSRFEHKLVFFTKFLKCLDICIMFRH